ncbi:hypothetical protein GORHZ_207_00130 [Gordonia rhizosphera NBRC 16068]|uniref:Recombinase n=2 Tax=Gordonia rhizosphera TaxID=83341 RepID=K6X2Y5_9ACTN|nr:hypothetical protein GORHZ_207_00130 [Gordonia rhizosphera NBRC 16068]
MGKSTHRAPQEPARKRAPSAPLRALIVVRLSRTTEATTSPQRQREVCAKLCAERGYNVVGVAEDLDVSAGKVAPIDRPQLGGWMRHRADDFDVIVFARLDRIARRMLDLADLIRWGDDHHVTYVSATESHFDLSGPVGRMIALVVGTFAEMELEAIRERNTAAAQHIIESGKHRGTPPWGYVSEKYEVSEGRSAWRIIPDPPQVKTIQEICDRVIAGEPIRKIAIDLTERDVQTARNRNAELRGKPTTPNKWYSTSMHRLLTSQTLLGRIVKRDPLTDPQGQYVRNDKGEKLFGDEYVLTTEDGTPITRADPIISVDTFHRVGKALAARSITRTTIRSDALLLRVLTCGVCGATAYQYRGARGRRPRYRCSSVGVGDPCGNGSIPLDDVETYVETEILKHMGPLNRYVRQWDTGSDHTSELADIDALLTDLTDQLGTQQFRRGTPQRSKLDARITALAAKQAELSALPIIPAGWRYVSTGETVAEWWARSTTQDRNLWLREIELHVSFTAHVDPDNHRTVVDDITLTREFSIDADNAASVFGPIAEGINALISD